MTRDLDALSLDAQVLIFPMLNHRNNSTSSSQYSGGADRTSF